MPKRKSPERQEMILTRPRRYKSETFDFQLNRAMQYGLYRASSVGECYRAADAIRDGDFKSWIRSWEALGARIAKVAGAAREHGHLVSARDTYLRAWNYYRAAEFFAPARSKRKRALYEKSTRCFARAAALYEHPFDRVRIPYEDTAIPGYFVRPACDDVKRKTVIFMGGGDLSGEESYFAIGGPAALERGYNVLVFDGPGQRGMLYQDASQVFRPDYEAVITPIVDYVLDQRGVDAAKLGFHGISLAGLLGARAAAFEHRIGALVLNSPMIDFRIWNEKFVEPYIGWLKGGAYERAFQFLAKRVPLLAFAYDQYTWILGVKGMRNILERQGEFHLRDTPGRIACPVLCLHSQGENVYIRRQTAEFVKLLRVPYKVRCFTARDGADAHCQLNNIALSHQYYLDWMDETLG